MNTRKDEHYFVPTIRRSVPWSALVAVLGVLAVLAAIFVRPAQADTISPVAGGVVSGVGRAIVGDHPVSSGAAIMSTSIILSESQPSAIIEIEIGLSENSGGSAVFLREINTGASSSVPNGTATFDLELNTGTALEVGKTYTFAVAAERYDQAGNVISHNFSLEGTTPRIRYFTARIREVAH